MRDIYEYLGIVYIMEKPDERRLRIFGKHEFSGSGPSGPYGKDGSWIKWGKHVKAPTHAEVQAFLKARDWRIAASKSRCGWSG
jgi:hypothetical protein